MKQKMNFAQTSRILFLTVLMSVIFVIGVQITAHAATLTVTKTSDTNDSVCNADCSLREAISTAASGDEIFFDATLFAVPQTIQLLDGANSTLLIDKNLTINGTGANLLTIRGATNSGTFKFRVFTITSGLTVHLKGLKITGGAPNDDGGGGGILTNSSSTTISDCFITENFSFRGAGGGIRNVGGTLTINNSTISGNSIDGVGGGGIDSDGTLFITDSTVSGNLKDGGLSGSGGIFVTGTATIRSSTITNNRIVEGGNVGGIQNNGIVTIRNTIIAGNVNVPDVGGANFISEGYNLIGATTGNLGFNQIGDQTGTIAAPLNPRLDVLANYGGTTPTHRLQFTPVLSPALDKGKSFGATTDQRGESRPIDNLTVGNAAGGDGADIGAFEAEAFVTVTKTADTNDGVCNADCSLREAIAAAPSGNSIIFSSLFDTAQTITLSDAVGFRELLIADKSLSIIGRGAQLLTIRRDSAAAANFRIFNINSTLSGFNIIVNISGMTISGGRSLSRGGGIRFDGDANRLTISDCLITGNSVPVAVEGGGISSTGLLTILKSTVSNNQTLGNGGGIYSFSTAGDFVMNDSTVSGNVASNGTGGIITGRAIITSSTITDNAGSNTGGVFGDPNTFVRNTIIAGNRNNSSVPDVLGEITSQDFNLIGNVGATTTFNKSSDQKGTSAAPINPLLATLALNGGTTPTHAILIGSPAIDAGFSFARTTDQRGSVRPVDNPAAPIVPNGDNTDIGAFESPRFAPIVVTKTADTNDGVCDSDCSLREAIAVSVRGTEIVFSSLFDTAQTITLSDAAGFQELLILDKSVSITGKGVNLLTIRRNSASPVPFRVFRIRSSSTNIRVGLNMSGVTVTGGLIPTSGGGIRLDGDENRLTLTDCYITGNESIGGDGGGIYSTGILTVIRSTISNNNSQNNGGGIYTFSSAGDFVLTNSTVSGNVTNNFGGGIFTSRAVISNSTVTDNLGGNNSGNPDGNAGGISGDANTIVRNSIVAANRNNSTLPDVSRFVSSQGYNIIGNVGLAISFNNLGDQTGNSAAPINPLLDALGNYGGTTLTHQLRTNSPAIDKGNSFGAITDQRGLLRPFDNPSILPANGGDNSDIGAFEVQTSPGTFVVTKIADTNDGVCDNDCSLREAIAAAASGNEIQFASPFFNTPRIITLSGGTGFGQLLINKNLTINGTGAHQLTIRRDSASPSFRIFNINGAVTVNLQGITITGGRESGVLNGNTSTLNINNCHITGNFSSDSGGGIRNLNGTLTLTNSTVSNNDASIIGGGGIHTSGGTFTISNSTVSGNRQLNGDNNAGGIWVSGGAMTITNSTITDNQTIGANGVGGIYQNGGTITIRNSIVAGNRSNATQPDVFGAFFSNGYNLIGNRGTATGFNQIGDQTGTSAAVINPQLAPLALSVNATTPTHALLSISPAIDKGNSFGAATDQRGQPRPIDRPNVPAAMGGDNSDIGAFETAILTAIAPQVSASPNPATADENQPTIITLTATDENTDMPLTFTITDQPDNGVISNFNSTPTCTIVQNLSNCSQTVTYTPNNNFLGTDSFSFKASDGQLESSVLTVNITVQIPANIRRVTKTADTNDGVCDVADCSLREAIATATSGNTIEFSAFFNSPQIITLSGNTGFGQLIINKNLTISGKGANLLTVRRDSASPAFRIFNISGAATVILQGMIITGGREGGGGAGVLNNSASTLIVNNCHITDNFANQFGGGIRNLNGTVEINNSTISNNFASIGGGGGIDSIGTMTITNSTVSGNRYLNGDNSAGGIVANGAVTITSSTITDNEAIGANSVGGIYKTGGTITIRNSIVAGNRNNAIQPDVFGAFTSNGYNIIGNRGTATGFGANDQTGTSAAIINPQISVLGNFGGTTPTHALFSNSTAINAADPSNPLATDQRGIVRTIGGRADIGAFENNFTFSNNPTGAGGSGTLPDSATLQFYSVTISITRLSNMFENIQTDAAILGSPFEFTLIDGSLPPGLMLDQNSGVLSGTPTQSGTYNFTIKATDPNDGSSGAQKYVLNIFGPTAATVRIGGQVLTNDGRGLRSARVTLTDQQGNSRTVLTSTFGYFSFPDVVAGETVIVNVASKLYLFQTQIINVSEDIADLKFTAIGERAKSAGSEQ